MSSSSLIAPPRTTSSPRTPARAGAAAFVIGGSLFAVEGIATTLSSPGGYPLAVVLGPAVVLMLVGYLGYAAVQHERTGRLGVLALPLVVGGLLVDAAGKVALLDEPLTVIGVLTFMAGSVLYGVATWRAGVFPRWCALGFILPLPLPLVVEGPGTILAGLLYVALGVALWARSRTIEQAPAPLA
ncbi:hypothetical protein FHU33_0983 [Blastococcus colisei]|uniref:Uncharacterized protein n=1 Tax=Blastococcus colisei TaxID=1564162 RepID=A0A543PBZ9_9ACTN|nr:hypothetical protein [Blastococcus colisei]TQN41613.1 hypothetical protein FHU33_0983 [Blastococcus colisei]